MKTLFVSFIAVILLTFCSAGITNAQQGENEKEHKPGKEMKGMMQHKDDLMKKLKLTDQQKEKIRDLRTTFQKNLIDLRADLKKNVVDLKALKSKDNLNRDDLIAAVTKVNNSKNAISLAVANHLFDLYQVLTPEQQKIWKENAHGMRGWGRKGNGRFGRFDKWHKPFGQCKGDHKNFDGDNN
jgi:Spy/CpxP family protein refolding chaperone